jgi:hypothetical protein
VLGDVFYHGEGLFFYSEFTEVFMLFFKA